MKSAVKRFIVLAAAVLLAACSPKDNMIGPRSEEAWKKWDEEQKVLKETWGETEIYAYVQTILDDINNVNANVVFKEDFSLENESKELDALKKLYTDMHYSDEISLKEFLEKLNNSQLRWAIGGMNDLDRIEDQGDDGYLVTLLYYPNADSLMAVNLTIRKVADGAFHTDFE